MDGALWSAWQFTGNQCACRSRRCPLRDNTLLRESWCNRLGPGFPHSRTGGRETDWRTWVPG